MVPADSRRVPRAPRYSGYRCASYPCVYRTLTVYGRTFQIVPLGIFLRYRGPTTPSLPRQGRFGLFPVRSPLLGESLLFSFPAGTKMFQFPALASLPIIVMVTKSDRVVPFGDRGIRGYLLLPRAFRSLSRPSSPPGAKASAMRPFLLSCLLYTVAHPHNPKRESGSAHTSVSRHFTKGGCLC